MDRIAIPVDCSSDEELEELAAFWAAALGYKRVLPDYLVDPEGVRPRFAFQERPETQSGGARLRGRRDSRAAPACNPARPPRTQPALPTPRHCCNRRGSRSCPSTLECRGLKRWGSG